MLDTMQSQQSAPACEHKPYFDGVDEWRCRYCGTVLAILPPQGRDLRGRDPGLQPPLAGFPASCISCRIEVQGQPDSAGRVYCGKCNGVLVIVDGQGNHAIPPFTAPRLLECTCCHEFKPQFAFARMNSHHGKNREYRQHKCRGCMAFAARVRRETDGERLRALDRVRPSNRPRRTRPPLTEAQRQAHLLSVKRYNARQQGRNVLKQRNGRQSILLKPICRVYQDCPLRQFCSVEAKGLA